MAELPSGTVTFLFTDIEGSTRLLARLRDRYADVLGEHQRLLRVAFDRHGGHEVGTEGDSLFMAFPRARSAVAAAVAAQRALACQRWPEGVDLRVRMGIHTGEAGLWDGDYVGLDVHRAARICSAGHGGQMLISRSTHELVADELPAHVALCDIGRHRLKGLDRPEHLFQIVAGDLPADFPPPLAIAPVRAGGVGILPPSPNRTIGRSDAVRAIAERLDRDDVRLLTLTGPGGVGKTLLALEAARAVEADFDHGARFVTLAAVRRAEEVPSAIVQQLAVLPLSGESPEQAATRYLSAKRLLLVVDNFEHVLAAASFIGALLEDCAALTVLATSREPLRLYLEQRYHVSPLAVPEVGPIPAHALGAVEAVALFAERARAQDARFDLDESNAAAVVEICRHVDGLPLAIELAAARSALLSPTEIANRLDAELGALGAGPRDAPARQQTLRATIDWSFDLLSDAEKECFARFAVFAGGATVQAAEAITAASLDTLEHLAAKSLLVRSERLDASTRLLMLETIRAYATERFAFAPDDDAVRERHYRHYLALARRHATERALWGAHRNEHLARLDAEIGNFDEALRWAVAQPSAEQALTLADAFAEYWEARNRPADAVTWIDQALGKAGADAYPAPCVHLLGIKAVALWSLGRLAEHPAVWAEAEAIARALGDPAILSRTLQPRVTGEALAGRMSVAEALADDGLRCAMTAADDWTIAMAVFANAMAAPTIVEIRERVDRAATLLADVGNVYQLAGLLASAAYGALGSSSDRDAKELIERAIPVARQLDDPSIWVLLHGNLGLAELLTGDRYAASAALREQ